MKNMSFMKCGDVFRLTVWYILLFPACVCAAYGQGILADTPLSIGDSIPDVTLTKVFNFGDSSIRLSDYKDKAVLLDFWATWCKPCVAAFPKLIEMQEKYKGKLQIVLLSADKDENIRRFYAERPDFPFPTVRYDNSNSSIWWKLFPHRGLPHYVWLDADHRVYGVTDSYSVNAENIERIIGKLPSKMYNVNDSLKLLDLQGMVVDSIEVGSMGERNISIDTVIQYGSQISKYDWRVTPGGSFTRKGYENRYLEFRNTSVIDLFRRAYFGFSRDGSDMELLLVENKNVNLDYPLIGSTENYDYWKGNNCYSYRLILPPGKADSTLRYQYMQRDLKNFFDLEAAFENREVDCLVLTCKNADGLITKGKTPSIKFSVKDHITLINQPMDELVFTLRRTNINYTGSLAQRRLPIINETGVIKNIDLNINGINSNEALISQLEKNGIFLEKARRRVKVLVIR